MKVIVSGNVSAGVMRLFVKKHERRMIPPFFVLTFDTKDIVPRKKGKNTGIRRYS